MGKQPLFYKIKTYQALSKDELYALLQLRAEVFVVEQDCPYLDADGLDLKGYHLMGYQGEKLVAYTRLLPKGVSYEKYPSIGRVITSMSVRREGLGKDLMQHSIDNCIRLFGNHAIKLSAQTYLLRFYQSFGFEPVGEEYMDDGIPHIAMIKQ